MSVRVCPWRGCRCSQPSCESMVGGVWERRTATVSVKQGESARFQNSAGEETVKCQTRRRESKIHQLVDMISHWVSTTDLNISEPVCTLKNILRSPGSKETVKMWIFYSIVTLCVTSLSTKIGSKQSSESGMIAWLENVSHLDSLPTRLPSVCRRHGCWTDTDIQNTWTHLRQFDRGRIGLG